MQGQKNLTNFNDRIYHINIGWKISPKKCWDKSTYRKKTETDLIAKDNTNDEKNQQFSKNRYKTEIKRADTTHRLKKYPGYEKTRW